MGSHQRAGSHRSNPRVRGGRDRERPVPSSLRRRLRVSRNRQPRERVDDRRESPYCVLYTARVPNRLDEPSIRESRDLGRPRHRERKNRRAAGPRHVRTRTIGRFSKRFGRHWRGRETQAETFVDLDPCRPRSGKYHPLSWCHLDRPERIVSFYSTRSSLATISTCGVCGKRSRTRTDSSL